MTEPAEDKGTLDLLILTMITHKQGCAYKILAMGAQDTVPLLSLAEISFCTKYYN